MDSQCPDQGLNPGHGSESLEAPRMNFTYLWVVVFPLKMHGSHRCNFFPLKIGLMLHEVKLQGCDDCTVEKSLKRLTEEPVLV